MLSKGAGGVLIQGPAYVWEVPARQGRLGPLSLLRLQHHHVEARISSRESFEPIRIPRGANLPLMPCVQRDTPMPETRFFGDLT